jgi:hypothetical protein
MYSNQHNINIVNFNIFLIIILFFSSVASNNISIPGQGRLSYMFFVTISCVGFYLFLKSLINVNFVIHLPFFFRFILALMFISVSLGGFIINDFRQIYIYYSFIFIFLMYWKLSLETVLFNNNVSIKVTKYLIFCSCLLILLGVAVDGIYVYRYEGIFDMPNSMGRFAGYSLVMAFVYLLFSENFQKRLITKLSSIFILFTPLMLSNSRAPLLASFISIFLLTLIFSIKNKIKLLMFVVIFFVTLIISISIYYFIPELIEIFLFKFNRGDGTSGRLDLWNSSLVYFNFFGSIEYNDLSHKIDVHNNYLSQALKYGFIPALAFHAIPLFLFIKSSLAIRKSDDLDLMMVFGLSVFLLIYYIFETASIIAPYWLMLFFSASAYKKIFK